MLVMMVGAVGDRNVSGGGVASGRRGLAVLRAASSYLVRSMSRRLLIGERLASQRAGRSNPPLACAKCLQPRAFVCRRVKYAVGRLQFEDGVQVWRNHKI